MLNLGNSYHNSLVLYLHGGSNQRRTFRLKGIAMLEMIDENQKRTSKSLNELRLENLVSGDHSILLYLQFSCT
jgi:hypothetical protein